MRLLACSALFLFVFAVGCGDDDVNMIVGPDADGGSVVNRIDLGTLDASDPADAVVHPDAEVSADAEPRADALPSDASPSDALPADGGDPGDALPADACSSQVDNQTVSVATPSHLFEGVVPGATSNGEFVIMEPGGGEVRGAVPTDSSGNYSVELPLFCGTQTVELSWMIDGCQYRIVIAAERTQCAAEDIRVTLTWDELGLDWELHLIHPGGRINDPATDCTWNTCISTSPDWGVQGDSSDDPVKDVDNTGTNGPENISLSGPVNGTFIVMVEHWGSGDPASSGEVTINIGGGATTVIPIVALAPRFVRYVAEIDWPSGTVTTLGTVYDCSATWSGGCQAMIP